MPRGSLQGRMNGLVGRLRGVGFGVFEEQLEIASGLVLQILRTVHAMEIARKDRVIQMHHQD